MSKKFQPDPHAIYLIDGSSFLFRAYYALPPLRSPEGEPSGAVYGFCRMIWKLIQEFGPHRMVLVWDSKGKTFRSEIYDDYKANRQAPPDELIIQKKAIQEFADIVKLSQLAQSGLEADDLIASMVDAFPRTDMVIVAADKDLQQLIDERVAVFDTFKDELIDEKSFTSSRGFAPEKLIMFHALVGDSSDNIPGVRGIGKKTAEQLVAQFESLEDLYNNLDKVEKTRVRTLLTEHKDDALLSKKLFSLKRIDVDMSLDDCSFDVSNWDNAYQFFVEYGFKSLLSTISAERKKEMRQRSLFDEQPEKRDWSCHVVRTKEALEDLVGKLNAVDWFAFDTETTGLRPLQDELVGLSFAFDDANAYYVPVGHAGDDDQLDRTYVAQQVKPIFENDKIGKTAHNAKFDGLVLSQHDIELRGLIFDSYLVAALLRTSWQKVGLKNLSKRLLGERMKIYAEVVGKQYATFGDVPVQPAAQYSCHDSLQTYKLKIVLEKQLDEVPALKKFFYDIELPTTLVLMRIEKRGIKLDISRMQKVGHEIDRELEKIEKKISGAIEALRDDGPKEINLNSPKQLEELLFDDLGLPVIKKSKEGSRSTDHEVLTKLSDMHPIPGMILTYRELFKLKSTYVQPLIEYVNPRTGAIHTTYSQTEVTTGRLSSYNPNLQNIPATENFGIKIRRSFVARPGYQFLSADYSQIDLRVLAYLTQDKHLIAAFKHNEDIHRKTAAQIFDVSEQEVTHAQRSAGKRVNFSVIYGMTPYGLSRELGITPKEAKHYIDKYFERYPDVKPWMETIVEEAKKRGFVESVFGRRRYVPELLERNYQIYEAGKRAAINAPVQGTAADIMKKAMICVDAQLRRQGIDTGMVLQIHDEIVLEYEKNEEKKVKEIVSTCMESVVNWEIPLTIDMRTGSDWGEITK